MSTELELLGEYKLVLGLEIHMHLNTKTKMFCRCSTDIYGKKPNTRTCPVCLGLPGALPIPNSDAVAKTQLLGAALECHLNKDSKFDRKHYFYPDLPKGYQISQYLQPLCEHGFLKLSSGNKAELTRIHLEEDTAKSMHVDGKTLIDFNKSGIPLVEIVTEPTFKSIAEASEFSRRIQDIARVVGISDADMEKGQLRLEANISLRTPEMERGDELPDYKVEIKNINSFKFMEKAVKAEIKRQRNILESGETPIQENRGYNEAKAETVPQRSKEEARDYRYFPEPDIPPMVFTEEYLENIKEGLSELPQHTKERLIKQFGISEHSAEFFSTGLGLNLLAMFEELCAMDIEPKKVAGVLMNDKAARSMTPEELREKLAADIELVSEEELDKVVKEIIEKHPKEWEAYKAGKTQLIDFFVGQAMRATKGKANAGTARDMVESSLT